MGLANIFGYNKKKNPVTIRVDDKGRLLTDDSNYIANVDEVDSTTTYLGYSDDPGALDSEAKWQIQKVLVVGGLTKIRFADASTGFEKVWNNRASYTY
jgi:hypothetical protein